METDNIGYADIAAIQNRRVLLVNHLYGLGFSLGTLKCMDIFDLEQASKMDCQIFNMTIAPFNAGKCSVTWSTFDKGLFINKKTSDCIIGYRKVTEEGYYVEFKALDIVKGIIEKKNAIIEEDELKFVLELVDKTSSWMDSFQNKYWVCPQQIAKAGRLLLTLFYMPSGRLRKRITKVTLIQYVQKVLEFKSRLKIDKIDY